MMQSRNVSPAIYFSDESYSITGKKLMGRQSAGDAFLRAYLNYFAGEKVSALLYSPKDADALGAKLTQLNHDAGMNMVTMGHLSQLDGDTLYVPSPGIEDIAWHRMSVNERQFSLCGVFHTTATHRIMDVITSLPTAPVRPWDAIICTSQSVQKSVQTIFAEQSEYLKWKVGATRFELPQLPVIPLGVHTADYQFAATVSESSREKLGIGSEDIVVLFVGRLSFHAKAHPYPMLAGLEQASQQVNRKIHLVQCGWFANDAIADAFADAGKEIAPNVIHHFLDGRDVDNRNTAWSCADIFVSLSDNIQETFGLTPIEAMAAGLPCIVSDWDGYKDTITDGVTGFRIPTIAPAPLTDGVKLAKNYALDIDNYDKYCGYACQLVGIDIGKFTDALVTLIMQPDIRKSMSEAALASAKQTFEWQKVMRQYVDLWEQLGHLRRNTLSAFGSNPLDAPAQRMDPFKTFNDYPTVHLNDDTQLTLERELSEDTYQHIVNMGLFNYAKRELPSFADCRTILTKFKMNEPLTLQNFPEFTARNKTVLWLIKIGCLSFS